MMIGGVLNSNAERVKNVRPAEIWLFIIARVLIGFGAGALLVKYFPQIVGPAALPTLIIGIVLFVITTRGLSRRRSSERS
jgi:uncharacterized membrane protein YfcA